MMVLHIVRAIFVLAVLFIAFSYATTPQVTEQKVDSDGRLVGLSPVAKVTLVILIPVVLGVVVMVADAAVQNKSLSSIGGLFFGVVAGVVLAYILGMIVDLAATVFMPAEIASARPAKSERRTKKTPVRSTTQGAEKPGESKQGAEDRQEEGDDADGAVPPSQRSPLVAMIKLLVGAFAVYVCVSFVLQTKDDFRFIIPYVEFAKEAKGPRPMLLDTSVIIDGRIADIADTRVLESELIVPRFVLEEIQEIADSADKLKRNRGRRGLDMLNRLQSNDKIDIRLTDVRAPAVEQVTGVDQKLVALGQHLAARIVTNDYNLNKIARLRGVDVININDLANALKPVVLPGETVTVKIIKPGEEIGQGVGYLDDGTMVVAEQGRDRIGQEMTIVVTSVLQTSAGRMIFGRPGNAQPSRPRRS